MVQRGLTNLTTENVDFSSWELIVPGAAHIMNYVVIPRELGNLYVLLEIKTKNKWI